MIVQKNFLSKLKDFGLNTYESKLWTALLSRGVSTAGELSDIANVPRSRSYDVLESLEKKGFVVMKLGKPIKYIAVPPGEVVERVKKRVKNEAEQREKQLEELNASNILEELSLLYNQGIDLIEPTDLAGSVRGRENLYNHMESMIKRAEKQVHLMTSAAGLKRKTKNLLRSLKKAKERGVKITVSAPVPAQDMITYSKLQEIANLTVQKETQARFLIVDNKEILFMLTDDESVHPSYDVGVWVTAPYFTRAIKRAFNLS
ncbi:TrmB family transcriptional regulator [Candidatus Woesearchaeota archaeon]|nr:TrmB family transcriptional regulator [Candidatus Woesearchaeota archaeon]